MATIRFTAPGFDRTIEVDAADAEPPTLLSLAKAHGVPLLFNCEAGDCGACVVHVQTVVPGRRPPPPPGDREATLLSAMSLLSAAGMAEAAAAGVSPDVRLACQYRPDDASIEVWFEHEL